MKTWNLSKKLLTASLLVLPAFAQAGSFEIIGEGSASHPAEFVKLNITLTAECFASSLEAKKHLDHLNTAVLDVLKNHIDRQIEGQTVLVPGANQQQVKTEYINNQNVTVCDLNHSWTSSSVVAFKLANIDDLASLQDELLTVAGAEALSPAADSMNTPRSNVALARPIPGVFSDTWDKLNDEALQHAHENALRQAGVLIRNQPTATLDLVRVTPTREQSGAVAYDRVSPNADPTGASLGSVSVQLARVFVFRVKDAP